MFGARYFGPRYFGARYWGKVGAGTGVTTVINWNLGNQVKLTLEASIDVLTLQNPQAGEHYWMEIVQDVTGSRMITWPSDVKWPAGGAPPVLSTAANSIDVVTMVRDNDSRYCATFDLDFS